MNHARAGAGKSSRNAAAHKNVYQSDSVLYKRLSFSLVKKISLRLPRLREESRYFLRDGILTALLHIHTRRFRTDPSTPRELNLRKLARELGIDRERLQNANDLARHAYRSRTQFYRVFWAMIEETPVALRRRLLLERAAWQLSRTHFR